MEPEDRITRWAPDDGVGAGHAGTRAGRLALDRVTFADASGRLLLLRVSLRVAPDEHVALVPASPVDAAGFGAVVAGLRDPANGCVTLDGRDVRRLRLDAGRRDIELLCKDTGLDPRSLAALIRDGNRTSAAAAPASPRPGRPDGEAPPRLAGALRLGDEEGRGLGIARALLGDPRVIVLEDPTGGLSAPAEDRLLISLRTLLRGRTALTVTTSPALALHAHRILVLHAGRVTQAGRPSDLLVHPGPFARLADRQDALAPLRALARAPDAPAAAVAPMWRRRRRR